MQNSNVFNTSVLLDASPYPMAIVDNDFAFLAVSKSWKDHYQLTDELSVGKRIYDILPQLKNELQEIYEECLAGNSVLREGKSSDKSEIVQWKITGWKKNDSSFGGVVIVRENISNQKKLQENLNFTNQLLTYSFDHSNIGMAILTLDRKFIKTNITFLKLFKITEDKIYNLAFDDFLEPAEVKTVITKLNRFIKSKASKFTTNIHFVKGVSVWFSVTITLIRNDHGKPINLLAQFIDKTDFKNATNEVEKSKFHLQNIMDQSNDIICYITYDGKVVLINKACQKIWGYPVREIVGKNLIDFVYEEDKYSSSLATKLLLDGINLNYFENRYVRKDKKIVPMNWTITHNAKQKLIFAIGRDATSKKSLEEKVNQLNSELAQKSGELILHNKHFKEFTTLASKDLLDPLRMVTGFLELLNKKYSDVLDSKGNEYIKFAVDGATQMKKMIYGLVEYSTIGENNIVDDVDLNEVLKDAKNLNRRLILETDAVINAITLPTIKGFKKELVKLFHALINNSLRYHIPDLSPVININCIEEEADWYFTFSDNGCGIEAEMYEKIFNLFQGVKKASRKTGMGLGLTIAQRIIEHHNGNILVESTLNKGTIFYFTISKSPKPKV